MLAKSGWNIVALSAPVNVQVSNYREGPENRFLFHVESAALDKKLCKDLPEWFMLSSKSHVRVQVL